MDDLVEQGGADRSGPPWWMRGAALAVALVLGGLIVTQTDVFSGETPTPARTLAPSAPGVGGSGPRSDPVSVVVREGDDLERYAAFGRRHLTSLPQGLPMSTRLVHAPRLDGTGPLVGVNQTVLFRADVGRNSHGARPGGGKGVTSIGRATQVIAPSGMSPHGLIVLQPFGGLSGRPRVVEVDATTGEVLDPNPFPGFLGDSGWTPIDVLASRELHALLMTRRYDQGRVELSLAWAGDLVRGGVPLVRRIGLVAHVLGVAGTRIVTVTDPTTCSRDDCVLDVVSVTRDRELTRAVEPPPGWVFGHNLAAGGDSDPLVTVSRADDPGTLALARLAAGARRGLLVPRSVGVVASVPPVAAEDGSVVFGRVGRERGDIGAVVRLVIWRPERPSAVEPLDLPPLPSGAELVCVCR